MAMRSISDRVAVITGAASGIGQDLALHLAELGCHLALVDINAAGLEDTAARIRGMGRRASTHVVDVASADQMEKLPEAVLAQHPRVDVLVNNAGVSLAGPFTDYSVEDLEWILNINLRGTIYGCKFFLPHMLRQRSGAIVNVSSDFGMVGLPGKTGYCTTKFAVRGFSEALRAEVWGTGVTVTCVYPPAVDTGMIRNSRSIDPKKREIEAEFVAKRGLPVREVSKAIARGIQKGQARVLIGRDTKMIDALARWFPGITAAMIGRFHKRLPFL